MATTSEHTESTALAGRELLLDVALQLFMEHGYEGVSMQQIATAASMTKGSPYYHFKGKEDLFRSAYLWHARKLAEGFWERINREGSLRERLIESYAYVLATAGTGMVRIIDDCRRMFPDDQDPSEDEMSPAMMRRVYQKILRESGETFRLSIEETADNLMAYQLGRMHMLVFDPESESMTDVDIDARRVATDVVGIFLDGVLKRS